MLNRSRHSGCPGVACIGLIVAGLVAVGGCGNAISDGLTVRPLIYTECDEGAAPAPATNLVVLNWDGGKVSFYPGEQFPAIDLTTFRTTEGGTLADYEDEFVERVRQEVSQIYCDTPDLFIRVEHDSGQTAHAATVIYVTQGVSPAGLARIGEAEYDICNRHPDATGIIYGEQMRRLAAEYTVDQWVNMFANTIAHEIGHTLGFGHVARNEAPDPARSLFVELMLESHTLSELVRSQRFLVEQDTCPADMARSRAIDRPIISCGHYGH
jgi:hypothetical protein